MPELETHGWRLEDGVARAAGAPGTFEVPDESIRSRLVPTSHAKLIFILRGANGVRTERMWVLVTGYTDTGYVGELDNDPETVGSPIAAGQAVQFGPQHVIDALPPASWNEETGQHEV